jgi:hypothetical protein
MAAEPTTASAPTTAGAESDAQKLLAKHAADEAHQPTLEEVVDEEDIAHPAPSAADKGKGKAADEPAAAPVKRGPAFDVTSEEAFPSLGGPKAASAPTTAWGKKPASAVAGANGTNGTSNGTSRASTPAGSGFATPNLPGSRPGAPGVSIPGREVERVKVTKDFLLPRQSLKRPILEVVRDVNRRSKAKIDIKTGNDGGLLFEVVGPADARRQALKEVVQQIGTKVCHIHDFTSHL